MEVVVRLSELWKPLGLVVKGFYSAQKSDIKKTDVAVCTLERANSLINSMLLKSSIPRSGPMAAPSCRIHELQCVVVDEIHLLSDASRYAVLSR